MIATSCLDSSKYYLGSDLAKSKLFLNNCRHTFNNIISDSARCEFVKQDLIVNIYLGEFDKAEECLLSIKEEGCLEVSQIYAIAFHTYKAYLFRVRSKYRQAIEEYKKVILAVDGSENKDHLIKAYYGIGGSHHRLEEVETAIDYFNKAKLLARDNNDLDSLLISNLYLSSGALYQEYGMWKEGLEDINLADKYQPNNSRTKIYICKNKAIMYAKLDSFEMAESYYHQMIEASKKNLFMQADAKVGLAKLYIKRTGFGNREEVLLKEAYAEFNKSGNKKTQANIANTLAIEYLESNELEKAGKWVKIHNQLSIDLNIAKHDIKNKYLNLKLHHLRSGNSTKDISEIALYADSIQLMLDNEKIRKNEISNKIKGTVHVPPSKQSIYKVNYLVGSSMLFLFLSMYFFFNGRSKINMTNKNERKGSTVDAKLILRLKTEKQELAEQHKTSLESKELLKKKNEELVIQKSKLEGLNQKLEKDIITTKERRKNEVDKLEIKTKGKVHYIPSSKLLYIHAEENGCRYFFMDRASLWNDEKLKRWEDKLDPKRFVRIHRSSLIQKMYVAKISYDKLSLNDGTELKIGRKYKSNI